MCLREDILDKKLTMLTGGGKPNELKEAIKQLRSTMPELIEHMKLIAELSRAKYDALIEQEFTPEQALELSKNPLNT